MFKKKFATAFLVSVMTAVTLTGCGNKEVTETTEAQTVEESSPTETVSYDEEDVKDFIYGLEDKYVLEGSRTVKDLTDEILKDMTWDKDAVKEVTVSLSGVSDEDLKKEGTYSLVFMIQGNTSVMGKGTNEEETVEISAERKLIVVNEDEAFAQTENDVKVYGYKAYDTYAAVLPKETVLYDGYDKDAKESGKLPAGAEVTVKNEKEDRSYVTDGKTSGWITTSELEKDEEATKELKEEEKKEEEKKKEEKESKTNASKETTASSKEETKPAAKETSPQATKPAATQPASTKPAATQPASTKPAATQPASTKPAATQPAPTKPAETQPAPTKPAHTHSWQPVTKWVDHPEKGHWEDRGHYENVIVGYTGYYICGVCGRHFDQANEEMFDHLASEDASYGFGKDPIYEEQWVDDGKVWVVDEEYYGEEVIDHYECSCGATK